MSEMNNTIATPTCMESVNRIAKLPVVESSIQTATTIYGKVRDYNTVTQWTCSTAENIVTKAVEVGKPIAAPIVQGLEGPIKKVDGVLCTGLDYVESKVPAVKLPPGEMYTTTRDYVNNTVTPAVGTAYSYVEPAVKTAYEKIEPAVQTAKTMVEPAVQRAMPMVQPALDKVQSLKDKLEEMVHSCGHSHPEADLECEECKAAAQKNDHQQ